MNNSIVLLLAVLAVLAWLPGCQPPEEPRELATHDSLIKYGRIDESQAHQAIVFLEFTTHLCSGTLIAPRFVLTAAHCTDGTAATGITAVFGTDGWSPTFTRKAQAVIYHPDWIYDSYATRGYDIALIELETPAPTEIAPIPPLPARMAITMADVGHTFTFVGFGKDEDGNVGTKRTVDGILDYVCGANGPCNVPEVGFPIATNTLGFANGDNGSATCSGDSGGPVILNDGCREYVAGITSYGDSGCNYYGVYTKVDVYQDFIDGFMGTGQILGTACLSNAQCQSGFCVEGVCCDTACDAGCTTCVLPRRVGTCSPATDGFACSDCDACNGLETCQGGVCTEGAAPECTSDNPCQEAFCDPVHGCMNRPLRDGTTCDDGDLCNGADACSGGRCTPTGTALDCDDADPCTADTCSATAGCQHGPAPDGAACPDADLCNGEETCQGGVCAAGQALSCDDGNPCTADTCAAAAGCEHAALADDTSCGDCQTCQAGVCVEGDCGSGGCAQAHGPARGEDVGWIAALALILFCLRRR